MIYAIISVVLASLGWGLLHYIKKSVALEKENEALQTQAKKLTDQLVIAASVPSSPNDLLERMRSEKL
jgi:hypothetical protein